MRRAGLGTSRELLGCTPPLAAAGVPSPIRMWRRLMWPSLHCPGALRVARPPARPLEPLPLPLAQPPQLHRPHLELLGAGQAVVPKRDAAPADASGELCVQPERIPAGRRRRRRQRASVLGGTAELGSTVAGPEGQPPGQEPEASACPSSKSPADTFPASQPAAPLTRPRLPPRWLPAPPT